MNIRPFLKSVLLVFVGYFGYHLFSQTGYFGSEDGEFVVHWHNDEGVVFAKDNKFMLRRSANENKVEVLFELPPNLIFDNTSNVSGCFGARYWHFIAKNGADQAGHSNSHHWQLEWAGLVPLEIEARSSFEHGNALNPIDCEWVDLSEDRLPLIDVNAGADFVAVTMRPDLFSKLHLEDAFFASHDGKPVLGDISNGIARTLVWPDFEYVLNSQIRRDRNTQTYFVVPSIRDAGEYERVRIPVLKFDSVKFAVQDVSLPNGPWVGEYKERFRCFSCGCGCYRDIEFFPAADRMLAHIYGIGFPKSVEGLYSISHSESESEWVKIVDGSIERGIAVSPSGCEVAYSQKKLQVFDLC